LETLLICQELAIAFVRANEQTILLSLLERCDRGCERFFGGSEELQEVGNGRLREACFSTR